MATSHAPVLLQLFDDYGDVLALGLVYTYAAGTDTPLVTYQDLGGVVLNENPVELDASGRATIRVTNGVAYKFIVKDADGNTIKTDDNVIVGEVESEVDDQYEVSLTYTATPAAQGWMGGHVFTRSVDFDVDFDGARGEVITDPGAEFVISIKKNGVEVGTATIGTDGVYAFETTGGATVSFISGDSIDFYGPDTIGTAANFKMTLVGTL